jgi:hypothetical protein
MLLKISWIKFPQVAPSRHGNILPGSESKRTYKFIKYTATILLKKAHIYHILWMRGLCVDHPSVLCVTGFGDVTAVAGRHATPLLLLSLLLSGDAQPLLHSFTPFILVSVSDPY